MNASHKSLKTNLSSNEVRYKALAGMAPSGRQAASHWRAQHQGQSPFAVALYVAAEGATYSDPCCFEL
jgi:hypothetical protein